MSQQHDKGKNWTDGRTVKQVAETDGSYSEQVSANLMGWDATAGTYVKLSVDHATGNLNVSSTGGGGGGAVTIADGADVAQGTTTDLSSANTVVGILKAIKAAVTGTLTVATHAVTQSGVWTVARSWTLSSATDSVNVGNFPATQPVSGTVTVQQATAANLNATVAGTVTANQGGAPWQENVTQVGGVAVAAGVKGTQQTNMIPTQDAKDAGRTFVSLILDRVTGVTTEALSTMAINKGGTTSSATSYTVTSGKTLRIQGIFMCVLGSSTTAAFGRARLRAVNGTLSVSSPMVFSLDDGSFTGTAAAGNGEGQWIIIPDGLEIPAGWQIGISQVINTTSSTISVSLIGYEY